MTDHVSAFDLDHTLITVNASFRFGAYLYKKGTFPLSVLLSLLSYYTAYKFFRMPVEALHRLCFKKLFLGRSESEILAHAKAFANEYIDELIYPPALARLRDAQDKGHYTAIFSASPDFLVAAIAQKLNIPHFWGSDYRVNKGLYSEISTILEGSAKASLLAEWLQQLGLVNSASTVYTDSVQDAPFLRAAGTAIGVNPDKKLKKLCLSEGWEVI